MQPQETEEPKRSSKIYEEVPINQAFYVKPEKIRPDLLGLGHHEN